jgi:hypothetical protein
VTHHFRWAYAVIAWLLVAAVLIQFALAGVGVFAPVNFCDIVPNGRSGCGFALHAWFGRSLLFLLFLLVPLLSLAARAPRRTAALSWALLGLLVLQGLLLFPYYDGPMELRPLSALHVVNAVVIVFVALHVAGRARDLVLQMPSSGKQVPAEIVVRPAEAKGD